MGRCKGKEEEEEEEEEGAVRRVCDGSSYDMNFYYLSC
mgnify:CR=1 FL=1